MPRIESGEERFEVTVPEGLKVALVDLETTDAAPLAEAALVEAPPRGATGRVTVRVRWSHPAPLGHVSWRLRVHASPDGAPPAVTVPLTAPGSDARLRRLFEEGAPVDLAVTGELARRLRDEIAARGGTITPLAAPMLTGVEVAAVVAVALAVLAAACIALGFAVMAGVLLFGLSRGYDVEDAGYRVAVGQGDSRQEHAIAFRLRPPAAG